MQTAAAAEATLPVDPPTSLVDDVMRILTGNSLFILFGIVLVILLLVVLMLRRNRAAKTDDHDIDDLAGQDFDADAAQANTEDSEKDEAATEFQDYDPSDLDSELDDIIGVSGEAGNSEEVEHLLEAEAEAEAEEAEQRETDESTKAEEAANRESETKSFLDDLGIGLDSFAYDDEAKDEPASTAVTEEVSVVSDDVDMMFDLSGDDDAGESNVEELESDETETFEFDLDDDSNAVDSEAKDSEDFDIDTLEFDVNPVEEVTTDVTTDEDEEIELETFAFDADATSGVPEAVEEKAEDTAQEADPNAVEFSFDADEIEDSAAAPQPISNEEVETFDFDLDDDDDDDIASDDDLDFLSADNVDIESADDIEEINMLSADDETATKLELAYAYQNMGDMEGATEILQEVIKEGSDEQIEEASKLLGSLDGKSG